MSLPLRAFLMLRGLDGNWTISVHREFSTVSAAWNSRSDAHEPVGVLHLGFDRPPTRDFDDLADAYPGRLLLTASAKFALPSGFEGSVVSVGSADGLPIHLGTRGWGYTVEDLPMPRAEPVADAPVREFECWVKDFVSAAPKYTRALSDAEIFNDDSYLAREKLLERGLRHRIGLFRLEAKAPNYHDPCDMARAAPPWLMERAFAELDLPVRAANVFVNLDIVFVRDLGSNTLEGLLGRSNFGRKSALDVAKALGVGLVKGPNAGPSDGPESGQDERTLLDSIRSSLLKHPERNRDIVRRRMGLDGPCETLEEIGGSYGLTRERIRQIEAKTVKRLIVQESWDDLLTSKLSRLLHERRIPLPTLGVEAVDPWFKSVGEHPDALRYVIEKMCDGGANLVRVDGVDYLAFLDQQRWEAGLAEARRLLATGVERRWSENHCRQLVYGLFPESAREFRDLLWDKARALCHFTPDTNNESVLTAYGRGAEHVVEAVLAASDRPLHFTEIADLASARANREIDPRRAHGAAAAVGILLGRGTYGLDRHLPVGPDEMETLGEEAADVVTNGILGRQWHASEILAALRERGVPGSEAVDKYGVDVALLRSGAAESLGRMVWRSKSEDAGGDAARIDLRQAVAAVLQQAGRPLRHFEIRQRLSAIRGVNENFQIPLGNPLVRLGAGMWGLNDRDLPIKRAEQPQIIVLLVDALARHDVGVHISEIGLLDVPGATELPPEALFSLAVTDPRVRISVGQYLHLTEWGGPRRESIAEAVERALAYAGDPLTFEDLVGAVEAKIGRPCDRAAVSGCLQAIEAEYDEGRRTWSLSANKAPQSDDEIAISA